MAPSLNKLKRSLHCAINLFLGSVTKRLFFILWCTLHIESLSHPKNKNRLHMFDWNVLEREVGFISPSCPDLAQISCPQGKSSSSSVEDALCRCDEECFQFGDCCFDYARQLRRTSSESQMRCLSWNGQHNIFTLDDCPPGFPDEALRQQCQKNQSDSSFTYLMDLAVINTANQRAYANVFCAICHGDSANLEPFNGLIYCDKQNIIDECGISVQDQILTHSNYNPGTRSWTLQFGSNLGAIPNCTNGILYSITCKLFIQRKSLGDKNEFETSRTCPHADTIGTCDVKKALAKKSVLPVDVERFQHLCKLYTLLVVFEDKIYKNPHCAVCNGIPLNRTRCISKMDLPISSIQTSPSDQHLKSPSVRPIYFAFSQNYNDSCVDSLNHCGNASDQVHDFIHNKAYNIRCGFLYQNKRGECVIRNVSRSQPTEGKDRKCYLKTLEQWELQGVVAAAGKAAGKSHAFPVEIGLLDVMPAPFPSLSSSLLFPSFSRFQCSTY